MTLDLHSAAVLPSIVAPPTIAFNPPGTETPEPLRQMVCPNCGDASAKSLVLTIDVQLPDNPSKRLRVLRCPACTANFYDSQVPPDYAEPALNNRGRVPFYVQQGAGVSLITRPLAQLRRPAGSTYMEVGCGYGFGLDFALNTRGWTGLGIDPAPLAALGRDALRLPIELRYLRDDDEARGTIDVVMGSEVIEHVTSPSAFVRTLKAMLKPGGVLILTTPNGDDIDPATPPGIIIPLLSPSLHLVIQNQVSLRALLRQAGFAHVTVEIDSHSLVAFASDAPLDLEQDQIVLRHALRDHLERRAHSVDASTDLFLAFAGRAFCESVNDGDMAAADRAWALLVPAIHRRFGLQIDALEQLPDGLATCSLEDMAKLVPLNLGGLLYARAIRRLAGGMPRPALEPCFALAAHAAAAMRRALGELAMEDGQTEDIGWTAQAEAVLCAADAGDPALASRLRALPPAPNGGEQRRMSVAIRALTNLVNSGQYDAGQALVRELRLSDAAFAQPGAELSDAERDAVFCLAILDAQIGADGKPLGNTRLARSRFDRVRQSAEAGGGLWWAALRGEAQVLGLLDDKDGIAELAGTVGQEHPSLETARWRLQTLVNIGRYEAARVVVAESGFGTASFTQPGIARPLSDEDRDVVFCLAMLDAEIGAGQRPVGEPAMARGRFARVRKYAPEGSGLWWAAFRGELQALDLLDAQDEAASLTAEVEAAYPDLQLPPDILVRIGKA
ncbi:MAG: class I SAM-dependent methyltransferase [Janthinobacterium lividum]